MHVRVCVAVVVFFKLLLKFRILVFEQMSNDVWLMMMMKPFSDYSLVT